MLLDLRDIPVVDNHCHGVLSGTEPIDVAELRHRFSECAGDPFPPDRWRRNCISSPERRHFHR